jgi:hypothetical protein
MVAAGIKSLPRDGSWGVSASGVGADSLPTLRLEPADLLVTLSEDRASKWPNPSTVSSDRCDLGERDLKFSLGNVA